MRGRKSFGEELHIIDRYSDLSESYFGFLKEKMNNGTDEDKWKAVQILKGAFEKMIPQTLDGKLINTNLNTAVECSPEEHDKVRQALLKSLPAEGSGD